jgi:plasmid stabilization system protein ParE
MVKWTPKSQKDLEKILNYISLNFNVELAIKLVNELIDYVEKTLSTSPLAGYVFEQNPLFSVLVFEGNQIFYCENPKDHNIYIVYVKSRGQKIKRKRISQKEISE